MPVLRGVAYFMWYFPASTAFLCILTMTGVQIFLYIMYVIASFLISYLTSDEGVEGNGRNRENGAESPAYANLARMSSLNRVIEEDSSEKEDKKEDNEEVDSEKPFNDYTSRRSDALSVRSSSVSYPESRGSYGITDDSLSVMGLDNSVVNETEAVLIEEASGIAGENSSLRKRK